jgi:phage baseplate assembly protein gpV
MEKKLSKILVIGILFLFLGASATIGSANLVWSDNFDSYANDQFLDGGGDDGGWEGWADTPSAGAYVRDDYSFSAPQSVEIAGASDLVHEYSGYTTGIWDYKAMMYIPIDFSGMSYFILLCGYDGGGSGTVWVVQVHFDSELDLVESEFNGEQAPIVYGEWVEFRCNIDLNSDWLQIYYDGVLLAEHAYTDTVQGTGGGSLNIAAVDLFANGASPVYYDDISLLPPGEELVCDAGGPYTGEINQDIAFTGFASGGTTPYTWAWDFGDGATATVQNPTHAYTTAGTYTATLTVTDAASNTATDTATVTVLAPQPVLEIGAITGGFGLKSSVKNTGEGAATNVAWTITLDGKLVFVGKSSTGDFATIAAAGEEAIKAGFILGFGKTGITVSATCDEGVEAEATASAFVLGPFILGVK